jgi:Family of unknown function (DUF5678)
MSVITLRPDLVTTLEQDALQAQKSVSDFVNDAIAYYIQARQQEKLTSEIAAYESFHTELKQKYLGQWVAIHNQQLVDHDVDRVSLYRRIRQQYGKTSVLLRQVEEYPAAEIWWRTPNTGKVTQP